MPEDLTTPYNDLFPRESDIMGIDDYRSVIGGNMSLPALKAVTYKPPLVVPEACIVCCGKCMKFLVK